MLGMCGTGAVGYRENYENEGAAMDKVDPLWLYPTWGRGSGFLWCWMAGYGAPQNIQDKVSVNWATLIPCLSTNWQRWQGIYPAVFNNISAPPLELSSLHLHTLCICVVWVWMVMVAISSGSWCVHMIVLYVRTCLKVLVLIIITSHYNLPSSCLSACITGLKKYGNPWIGEERETDSLQDGKTISGWNIDRVLWKRVARVVGLRDRKSVV